MSAPVLFTPHLVLRAPEPQDFDAFATMCEDADTMRFIGGPMTRMEAWRSFCAIAGAWSIRGFSMFSVIERETGRWIGRVGPWMPEGWPGKEVGWGVAPEFAGRGYAYEAAVASIDYAINVLGWEDVMHIIAPENRPSIKLAERVGATNRGPTRLPPPIDHKRVDNWGQTAERWKTRRREN